MNTWTVITLVAFATSAIYLLTLGFDWLLEKRFRRILYLLRKKEAFERHASHLQECIQTFQFLEHMLLMQASFSIKKNIETEINSRWDSIANVIRSFHSDPSLQDLCDGLVEYKKQQDVLLQALGSNSDGATQIPKQSTYTDAHHVMALLGAVGRKKTHETFHAICSQLSPLFWPLASIPFILIAYLGSEVLRSFYIT